MHSVLSFFLANSIGAPYGLVEGHMNPFSKYSSSCLLTSAISAGLMSVLAGFWWRRAFIEKFDVMLYTLGWWQALQR